MLEWKEYGFRMHVPEGATSVPCDFAVKAIVAGQFQFPVEAELVSAVYAISASRRLKKPVKIEIQHCVTIKNEQQGRFLAFVRAQCNQPTLPYKFQLVEAGMFPPHSNFGIIPCDDFSLFGALLLPKHLVPVHRGKNILSY